MAGVDHDDIDVRMIYDSFTITVLATLENLGFCKVGEGGPFVTDGRIRARRSAAGEPGRRRPLVQPPRHARDLPASSRRPGNSAGRAASARSTAPRLACVHGTGGTLGVAHSGATLVLGAA